MEAALTSRAPCARLQAVADAIAPGATVADIGTDHAHLLAWLSARGHIARGIGIDVASGPLTQARRTLSATRLAGITLRQGDGLQPLEVGEVDTVVLAGMGGARIMRLVDAAPRVVQPLQRLVMQPNTDWVAMRRWILEHGWALHDERMVCDRGKFYLVLVVQPQPGSQPGWTEDALHLGPRLLEARDPSFVAWLRHEQGRVQRALQGARAAQSHDDPRVTALHDHAQRLTRALTTREAAGNGTLERM